MLKSFFATRLVHISMVKKLKTDGTFCTKCVQVQEMLEKRDYMKHIDEVIIAQENNPKSSGMILANKYKVNNAPFFIVKNNEKDEKPKEIFTMFYQLKNFIEKKNDEKEELEEINKNNPVDFLYLNKQHFAKSIRDQRLKFIF
jgi:hypothetical protein